jgi:hypothetical protein
MRKFIGVMLVTCVLGLTACGFGDTSANNSTVGSSITINKNGSISNSIVEEFEESYYDIDSLKTMIETSISEYNNRNSGAGISLKSCKMVNSMANVTIEYGNYSAYSGFNNESFFVGTVTDANFAGYDLNITLKDASDSSVTISKPQLLEMGDNHIVILEAQPTEEGSVIETVKINCYDEILYVGDGVAKTGKKSADMNVAKGYGIIVFK